MASEGQDSNNEGQVAKHKADPKAEEHWLRGNSLFDEGKFDEAIEEYTQAINIDNEYSSAYFNRALNYAILKKTDYAKKDLQSVLEIEPKSADAPLLLGDIAEQSNDLLSARFWYEKSLSNDPNYAEAKNRLEHIDSLLHMDVNNSSGSAQVELAPSKEKKKEEEENKTIIEEGQVKRVAFYKSNVKFDQVVGMAKVKEYLMENVVLAMKRPDLFKKYGKKLGLGLILYGPPGTGKTHIVNAIAGEAGANVIVVQINQILDMYTGNTEKNLHQHFQQARENTPCILFFDELDALGVKRGGGEQGGEGSAMRTAVNAFLTEMNGVIENPEGLFVIGATNQPWDIDPALKRSGRFGDSIYINPPGYKDRKGLFELYTRNKPHDRLSFGRLARATSGYSPADIAKICDRAAMRPLLHEHKFNKGRNLNMRDMLAILKDKDMSGSSLDEWYSMVKKDVISKTEVQIVDGKRQEIVKEGKLDAQEKVLYKSMVKDIKKNTSPTRIRIKKFMRWWALHFF
ncbi:MAG: AAA family ATPase [Candidatus Micrarchaeia archaeon]